MVYLNEADAKMVYVRKTMLGFQGWSLQILPVVDMRIVFMSGYVRYV